MVEISMPFAVAIIILWPLLTVFCVWKYLRAVKEKKRMDKWIWFFALAVCMTAIEFWVLSVMVLL
jgi:hypothetical protein